MKVSIYENNIWWSDHHIVCISGSWIALLNPIEILIAHDELLLFANKSLIKNLTSAPSFWFHYDHGSKSFPLLLCFVSFVYFKIISI